MENDKKSNEYTVKNKFENQINDAKTGYQITFIKKEAIENSANNNNKQGE